MHFDFYERYKDYPDTELQKITQQPDAYQPDAVDAALRILKERGVKEEKVNSIHLLDSFEITEEAKPPKLLTLLLVLLALEFLWKFYNTAKVFFYDGSIRDTSVLLISFIPFVYSVFVFYLLLKRKSWGWILTFVSASLTAGGRIMQLDSLFKYIGLDTVQGAIFMAITFLNLFLAISLWQKEILAFFNITTETRRWTALAAFCILALLVLYRFSSELGTF
ncbi:hypothetical protein [Chitinophaga niabensis]|uniref:Uncharacterized protein n=1 Tax=Chitinophaga niabensis TaxID=536979 RepID=A0A1N6KBV9_9BACT|nr:hypothetical protein [Chitinophaga niabensis]SIO54031.1 hypothetical protein SAMN04488055_5526 [Chitinophaga niabensis]